MIGKTKAAQDLMLAMAKHEGWHPPNETSTPGGSRAYRNHNPGNLRASPFESANIDNFSIFRTDFVGFMAFEWDLIQKATGNTITDLGPKSTLRELIFTWAPPSDNNNTEAYLTSVVQQTGLSETTTLAEIFDI